MEQSLGLADFLTELRGELADAQAQAAGEALKLGVGQVELSLDVAYTVEKTGGAEAKAKAKFWVLASAEAGVSGSVSSQRVRTQHLKLLLTPRVETTVVDESGATHTVSVPVEVDSRLEAGEERAPQLTPPRPAPPAGG